MLSSLHFQYHHKMMLLWVIKESCRRRRRTHELRTKQMRLFRIYMHKHTTHHAYRDAYNTRALSQFYAECTQSNAAHVHTLWHSDKMSDEHNVLVRCIVCGFSLFLHELQQAVQCANRAHVIRLVVLVVLRVMGFMGANIHIHLHTESAIYSVRQCAWVKSSRA